MYTEINKCRISGSTNLIKVISLGEQYLTGVFPKSKEEIISKGPLDLMWCPDSGLLQLKQSYCLRNVRRQLWIPFWIKSIHGKSFIK